MVGTVRSRRDGRGKHRYNLLARGVALQRLRSSARFNPDSRKLLAKIRQRAWINLRKLVRVLRIATKLKARAADARDRVKARRLYKRQRRLYEYNKKWTPMKRVRHA